MKYKRILNWAIFIIMLVQLSPFAFAENGDDLEIFGLELEKLLNLGSGLLATGPFIFTVMAYRRTKRKRLMYVSLAFLLFALKGFLMSTELFFGDLVTWIDPVASFLDFAILFSFFFGILRK